MQAYQFILEREKKSPYQRGGGLVFVFTKSTTINFQNTVTVAQVLIYSSVIIPQPCFSAVLCAWISHSESMLSLHFELLTTGGIIPVAIEIRQAYCYLYYGIT